MGLKVTEEKEELLLSRKKITAQISFKGATPSNEEVKKQLASSMKADGKLIVIKNIATSFGSETADIVAYQYINEEDMKKIEPKEKEKKAKPKKEAKEAPKEKPKKEEAKEAPKKEEVKKEAPKEKPKKQEKK